MANCDRTARRCGEERESVCCRAQPVCREEQMEPDVPMSRYPGAIPLCPPPCGGGDRGGERTLLEQLLEETCRQNQILLDLLAAVNSLTAAALSARR